jgi:hypothetical protein
MTIRHATRYQPPGRDAADPRRETFAAIIAKYIRVRGFEELVGLRRLLDCCVFAVLLLAGPSAFAQTVYSIWPSSSTPGTPWTGNGSGVTLGIQFRSDVAGTVNGIRFYKGTGNTGSHIGLLYSSTGAVLAQVTFANETASGWQQMSFSSPVAITANTDYVAAYFTTTGFALDVGYFGTAGVDNAPLHAPQFGAVAQNGIYVYGSIPQFPTTDYQGTNYWVDVAFSPSSSGPGTWSSGSAGALYYNNGNVGIGTTSPQYRLSVNGVVGAKEVVVTITGF